MKDTLTLHRLDVFAGSGMNFKTTNLIESVMARVEATTRRVDHWRSSDQKRRWCAATLLQIERQCRSVKGVKHLPLLQRTLRSTIRMTPAATGAAPTRHSPELQLIPGHTPTPQCGVVFLSPLETCTRSDHPRGTNA